MQLLRTTIQVLAAVSLVLAAAQIYLTVNKIWKRKHERAVAESVSIMGEFIGLLPLIFLTLSFLIDGQWTGVIDGLLWMLASCVMIAIGTGVWVEGQRGRRFWSLLRDAIKLERGEVGALAQSLFRPAAASKILSILGRLSMIDNRLDARERAFIQTFAEAWGLPFNPDKLHLQDDGRGSFIALRNDVADYLATSPPPAQVRQVADVANALVAIDDSITEEETVMLAELDGMWHAYLEGAGSGPAFVVALVPQSQEQDEAIKTVLPDVGKTPISGGEAYVVGRYHSERYAEIVGRDYRALNIFTTVIRVEPTA